MTTKTALLLAVLSTLLGGNAEQGLVSQYAPGVMERVVRTRQAGGAAIVLPQNLPEFDGYAAVPHCNDIGHILLARFGGGDWELFLAVDCGSVSDGGRDWMLRNNVLIEVDHQTAARHGFVGRIIRGEVIYTGVTVWDLRGRDESQRRGRLPQWAQHIAR